MEITIESIKKKLGFDPLTVKAEYHGHEDDSIKNPFDILSNDEVDFLDEYFDKVRNSK